MLLKYTFILLIAYTNSASNKICKATTEIPNIINDSLELMVQKQSYQLNYNYPVFIFTSQPHIALSISKFEWKNFQYIDYTIKADIDGKSGALSLEFKQNRMEWRVLRITFWIFQRNDMIAGVVSFENIEEYSHAKKKLQLSNPIKQQNTKPPILFTTIISIKAFGLEQSFEIGLSSQILQGNQFSISVETGQLTQIMDIKVGYLLFEPSAISRQSHNFGILQAKFHSQNLIDLKLGDIQIYPIKYELIGISAIRLLKQKVQSLSFSMYISQDPSDFLKIISSSRNLDYVQVQYFFLGHSMMMSCIQCPDSHIQVNQQTKEAQCISVDNCQSIKVEDNSKMYFSCRQCPNISYMKVQTDKKGDKFCSCEQGYIFDPLTSRCIVPIVNNSIKRCPDPFQIRNKNGSCECRSNFYKDEFGMCVGICSSQNSYWDSQYSGCRCFDGFEIKPYGNKCELVENKCGLNQVHFEGKCECDANTIWDKSHLKCVYCDPGTYKNNADSNCKSCVISCLQCLTQAFCTKCIRGFFLHNFLCIQICGDGLKMSQEPKLCDDGNTKNGDGCSKDCQIEVGYHCEGGSSVSQDLCYNGQELEVASLEQFQTNQSKSLSTPISSQDNDVTYKKADQQVTLNQNYTLKLNSKSPVFLNSGIVIDMKMKPQIRKTQQQINQMFKIQISKDDLYPQSIYLSQDQFNIENIRCYLHYNNQLPIEDYSLSITATFGDTITRSLNIYINSLNTAVTSALGFDDEESYIL